MHKAKFEAAKKLIQERRYQEAKAILKTIHHPKAAHWLAKLEALSPEMSEDREQAFLRLADDTILEVVDAPDKLKRKPRKPPPLYLRHRLRAALPFFVIVLVALAIGFGGALLLVRRDVAPAPTMPPASIVASTSLPSLPTSVPVNNSPSEAQSLLLASIAQKALDNNDIDLAIRLALEANQVPLPLIQVQQTLFAAAYAPGTVDILTMPNAKINALAPSPDGTLLAVSYWTEDPLRLWDLQKRTLIRTLDTQGLDGDLDFQVIAFSPGGRYLVAGGMSTDQESTVTPLLALWDTATGQRIRSYTGHKSWITAVTFSPDGRFILSGSGPLNDLEDSSIRLWDVETGEQVRQYNGHTGSILSIKFRDDSNEFLSAADNNSVILWDSATGTILRQYPTPEGDVFSADLFEFESGEMFALTGGFARAMYLLDLDSGQLISQYAKHSDLISSVRFSPDGYYAASGSWDQSISLVDLIHEKEVVRYRGHTAPVESIAFSPDGQLLFSGDGDGNIRLWSVDSRAQVEGWRFPFGVRSLALSPDQKTILLGYQNGLVSLKDATMAVTIRSFQAGEQAVVRVVFSPDGRWAISATDYPEQKVILWDIETGKEIRQLKDETSMVSPKGFTFSPDSRMIVANSDEGKPYLWDIETGTIHPLETKLARFPEGVDYTYTVGTVVFTADSSRVMASLWPDTIVVWEVATGKILKEFTRSDAAETVTTLAFTPDEQSALAGYSDGTIVLWNISNLQEIRRIKGHDGAITDTVFTPNGQFLISSSESMSDNLILWDVASGEELYRFPGYSGWVNDLALSADGSQLYTASSDSSLQVWYIPQTLSDLKAWVAQNRYIRELTCEERQQYQIEPSCET